MLPAHSYPALKKFKHLKGHYGGAWQKQRKEFEAFGGPIVVTTNCVLIPTASSTYLDKLFMTKLTGIPGAPRIEGEDFSEVIAKAKAVGDLRPTETKTSLIGFHYNQVLGVADKVVAAVKSGEIKHFFLIGGCDGAESGRNYFTEYAQATPQESLVLTLGCGKFRIRDYEYGTVAGLPRFLDMGQCNDAYSAVQVAVALAKAFDCGVNDLPLTFLISWFEQKAVAVLLTLLHLGVTNIQLGPALPAFVSPKVLAILQEKFALGPIGSDPKADVAAAMAQ